MKTRCIVCLAIKGPLCARCRKTYIYDKKLYAARLKKTHLHQKQRFAWKGELRLYAILKEMYRTVHRDFRPEFALSPKGAALEYDFCIPRKRILIELDGPYHYDGSRYKDPHDFKYRQLCDSIKEKAAESAGWKFFRLRLNEVKITKQYIRKLLNYQKVKRVGGKFKWRKQSRSLKKVLS